MPSFCSSPATVSPNLGDTGDNPSPAASSSSHRPLPPCHREWPSPGKARAVAVASWSSFPHGARSARGLPHFCARSVGATFGGTRRRPQVVQGGVWRMCAGAPWCVLVRAQARSWEGARSEGACVQLCKMRDRGHTRGRATPFCTWWSRVGQGAYTLGGALADLARRATRTRRGPGWLCRRGSEATTTQISSFVMRVWPIWSPAARCCPWCVTDSWLRRGAMVVHGFGWCTYAPCVHGAQQGATVGPPFMDLAAGGRDWPPLVFARSVGCGGDDLFVDGLVRWWWRLVGLPTPV